MAVKEDATTPASGALVTGEQRLRQGHREERVEAHKPESWSARFARASTRISEALGSGIAFLTALLIIAVWAITGPIFGFSDTWQLVINTGTTIVTFLMVFVIQNTQNRDAKATQVKLDELIRAAKNARNQFIGLEDQDDEEVQREKEDVEAEREEVDEEHAEVDREHEDVDEEHEDVEQEHAKVEEERNDVETVEPESR
jgi:low affinity Fe/Cu permease